MPNVIRTAIATSLAAAFMLTSAAAIGRVSSFDEIAAQALATHPSILSRFSSAAAAKADSDGAEWQRYPTPSLELNSDHNGALTTLLRVQQPLWASGRIDATIDAAQSRHRASATAIHEAKQDVMLRVIAAYVEAMRQQARQQALTEGVQQHERLLGLIARRVEHEAGPRVDQELAQSRLYQARNDLSAVTQALANALTQLSQLSGMQVRTVAALDLDKLFVQLGKEPLVEQALAWSPILRRLGFEEDAAHAEVELKKASYKPQVSLRYENSHASAALNGIPAHTTGRLMLVVEAQTGAGLSALSGVEAAVGRWDAVRQQREAALRDLHERLSIDWDEFQAARARLENAALASKSAREVFESYTRQYTAGRKTWLDVLNTVREATLADVAATDAGAQAAGAALRLKLLSGALTGMSE